VAGKIDIMKFMTLCYFFQNTLGTIICPLLLNTFFNLLFSR